MSDYPAGHENIDNGEEVESPAINEALIATLLERVCLAQVEFNAAVRDLERAAGFYMPRSRDYALYTVDEIIAEMEQGL